MRKLFAVVLLIAGIWLLWGHPLMPAPSTPAAVPASGQPGTSVPTAAPVDDSSRSSTAPVEEDSERHTHEQMASDEVEEGHPHGGFDPAAPPPGAPDPAQLQLAFHQADGYVTAINSYGYGDANLSDFVTNARPYMTEDFYQEWADIAQFAIDEGTDLKLWTDYHDSKTRHTVVVGRPTVISWTATELELAVPYQAADLPVGGSVPSNTPLRYARVSLVQTDGTWLVRQASSDF